MLKNTLVELKLYEDSQLKHLFLKDPKSDIFIIIQNRIIPLHKKIIKECIYLRENALSERVYFIKENLDLKVFQKVVSCLYGYPLQFSRDSQTMKILQVVMFLQIQKLCHYFLEDFKNNFDEYGIFTLFGIAKKYKIQWLEKKCIQEFISCQFEQFHINKYDLMNNDKETFQQILKHHAIFKTKGLSQGVQDDFIQNLIEQYSCLNSTRIDASQLLSLTEKDQGNAQKILNQTYFCDKNQKLITLQNRKRNSTWDASSDKYYTQKDYNQFINKKKISSSNKSRGSQTQLQVLQLKQINKQIIKRASSMISQIKQAQQKLSSQKHNSQNKRIVKITQKLSQFAQIFQQQQEKLLKIKNLAKQMSYYETSKRF